MTHTLGCIARDQGKWLQVQGCCRGHIQTADLSATFKFMKSGLEQFINTSPWTEPLSRWTPRSSRSAEVRFCRNTEQGLEVTVCSALNETWYINDYGIFAGYIASGAELLELKSRK